MATEKRLIDADALMKRFRIVAQSGGAVTHHCSDICAAIEDEANEESVDAVEVVHGEWLFGELDVLGSPVKCSNCGWGAKNADPILWMNYPGHKFCGNCGADMRGEKDGN